MKTRIWGKLTAVLATGLAIVFWIGVFNGEGTINTTLSAVLSFALGILSFILAGGFGLVVRAALRVGRFGYGMLPLIFGLVPAMLVFSIAVVVFVQMPAVFVWKHSV